MTLIKLAFLRGMNLLLAVWLTLIITPNILTSQTHYNESFKLPDYAMQNFSKGLQSDIYGIKMSLIYYSGKYKLRDVSKDLLEIVQNSTDEEICQMAVWSLYQIGEDSLCEELESLLNNHPSEKLKNFCKVLKMIRNYDPAFIQI